MLAAILVPAIAASAFGRDLIPPGPDAAAAAAAGPVSTAAWGARCIGPAFDDTPAFQAAIDTGHTVYAPALGGQCHITRALVMKTPGQIFHGDGRARTKIVIQPGFVGEGVFVAKTGEPGPVWRDFSVSFVQPDTDRLDDLIKYPPAFEARATPRFQLQTVGCFAAWICLAMQGNSGGAVVTDFTLSAFERGVIIDGSEDTIRLEEIHGFPFELSEKQRRLLDRVVWLDVGRVDGLMVSNTMFLWGEALSMHASDSGSAIVSFENVGFDTSRIAIEISAGKATINGGYFALGTKDSRAVLQRGGKLAIASALVTFNNGGFETPRGVVDIDGKDSYFIFTGSPEVSCQVDMPFMTLSRGTAVISNNIFLQTDSGQSLRHSKIYASENSNITAVGNRINPRAGGIGTMFSIRGDNPNTIFANVAPGWAEQFPKNSRNGVYMAN